MTTKMNYPSQVKYDDWNKISLISEQLCEQREELLEKLGIEYSLGGRKLYGPCPVHGGDKFNAWNWYESGKWVCRTHNCQNIFKATPIGFLRGLLSNLECGWTTEGDRKYGWDATIEFALKFLNQDYSNLKIDLDAIEKKSFAKQIDTLTKQGGKSDLRVSRQLIRSSLVIPSQYYIDRGYSAKILDRYDVGYCSAKGKQMTWRVVVPIYDEDDNYVGCTGRSILPECSKCGLYHSENYDCPSHEYRNRYTKWKHSDGFRKEDYLYNLNFAKKHIQETTAIVLVESPGNVWRLEEAGIHNSVACFGATLNEGQKALLDGTGALSIIVLGDNDEAGKSLAEDVKMKCERTYRLYFPKIDTVDDIGEMSVDKVTSDVKPIIEKLIKDF